MTGPETAGRTVGDAAQAAAPDVADPIAGILRGILDSVSRSRHIDATCLDHLVGRITGMVSADTSAPIRMHAPEESDIETAHGLNVAILSVALAKAAGLDPADIAPLCQAALLHDVGKRRVSPEILNKPQRLSDTEFEVMRGHPSDGARLLLQSAGAPQLAIVVAFEHHLTADGRGYPEVPYDWRMNVASAIVSIADCFDGLQARLRASRSGESDHIAAILKTESGTRFDPGLLETFLERVVPRIRSEERVTG